MKKVIALMLAVLMLGTVAFAVQRANVSPGTTIKISRDEIKKANGTKITAKTEGGYTVDLTNTGTTKIGGYILRSVNNSNYSVTNVKFKLGKGLVEKVEINDTDDCVDIIMADDLTNVKSQNFEVSFKLKGKAKLTLDSAGTVDSYKKNQSTDGSTTADKLTTKGTNAKLNDKVTLPDLEFEVAGTVGYGQATVYIGTDNDEEIENLENLVNENGNPYTGNVDDVLDNYIFKFSKSTSAKAGKMKEDVPQAGAFTADALLTQDYGDALTMEARVYDGDKLYFGISNTPIKSVINRLADSDGDLDFYRFNKNKEFTTFNSNVKLYFNDADEDCFVYAINSDNYLVPANGSYSEEDGCWVVKTRTLGQYVVSDVELKDNVVAADGDPATTNPDTGANDVVGIATALAAVALVSAAAVSLKK